ncbi:MAG: hypothetical protein CYPHOPRED_000113 [Cyphobasidiales sp. Tagirdzhanova-0007]|nr:MAG: hypothetical protein CYPHOPRED_000113 [Cyphobasidiales sp. Tagirdzhanova-0007]
MSYKPSTLPAKPADIYGTSAKPVSPALPPSAGPSTDGAASTGYGYGYGYEAGAGSSGGSVTGSYDYSSSGYGYGASSGPTSYGGSYGSYGYDAGASASGIYSAAAGSFGTTDEELAAQQSIYTLDNNVAVQQLTKKAQKGQARNTVLRKGAGEVWEDPTLMEWDPAHFRLFIGDLGNDVNEDNLIKAFGPEKGWMSFVKAKVVRDKVTNKTRGYGFVSYVDPDDFMKAWKAMDGKYVGSRPIKIQKATTGVRRVDIGTKKARELDTKKKSAVIGNKACLTLRDLYNKLTLRYTGPRHSQSLWELETVRASLSKSSL